LAAAVYGIMWIWHRGSEAVERRLELSLMPVADFSAQAIARETPRVPGTAVFLTRTSRDVPPVLLWHLQHNRALHQEILVLTVNTASIPRVAASKRLSVQELAPNFWRADAVFGFMDQADIPALLETAKEHDCKIDLSDVTYYVGHGSIMHRDDGKGIPRWQEALYAAMERNSTHVGDVLRLPQEQTVEIGRQIAI
jgi:KUP system potassium uptake protein